MKIKHNGPGIGFLDNRYVRVTGDLMTGTLNIQVPTATTEALILKTTDDNATKKLLEFHDSSGVTTTFFDSAGNTVIGQGTQHALAKFQSNQEGDRTIGFLITGKGLSTTFPSDDPTAGAAIALIHNATGNRQIAFGDSDHFGQANRTLLRFITSNTASSIDVVGGDGNDRMPLMLGTNSSDVFVGGIINQSSALGKFTVWAEAAKIGLVIRGFASQSANLTEWQDSSGTPLISFQGDGDALFTKHMGIGANASINSDIFLEVRENVTDAGTTNAIESRVVSALTTDNDNSFTGFVSQTRSTPNGFDYTHEFAIRGVSGVATHTGTGTVTGLVGVSALSRMSSAGIVTNAYAFYGLSVQNSGGGTVDNAYGLYLEDQNVGSNNYAIYTNAGLVRFGDDVIAKKHMAIGNNADIDANEILDVTENIADPIATFSAIHSLATVGLTANNANRIVGYEGLASSTNNAFNLTNSIGLVGVDGRASYPGSGTVTGMAGVFGRVQFTGSGTVENAYALYAQAPSNTGGGTLTNNYGLYVVAQTQGVNNYSIYTNAGNVRFGDDTYWEGEDSGLLLGSMYVPGVDIVVATGDTNPHEVADGSGDGWSAGELNGVTFPTDGTEHYLTITRPGKYEISWNMSFHNDAGTDSVHGGVMINGVAIRNNGEAHRDVSNANDSGNMGAPCIADLTSGDEEISLWVASSGSNSVHVEHSTMTIKLIGGT